jgi:hypothetical protein
MKKKKPESDKKSGKKRPHLPDLKPKSGVTKEQAQRIRGGDEGSPTGDPTRLPPPPPPGG